LPPGVVADAEAKSDCGIVVSISRERRDFAHTLHIVPRIAHIGVGCRRGAEPDAVISLAREALERQDIHPLAVASVASVDVKSDESAILRLAEEFSARVQFFSAEELAGVPGEFAESEFVKSTVGVGNVCERAAVLSAGARGIRGVGATLVARKTLRDGATVAVALENLEISFESENL
jgi:cobalt-precorrin 5A hydrolase